MAKICIIGPTHPYRGGIAHHTTHLSEALAAGHAVEVFNFTRLYPSLLFPGSTQLDESGKAIGFPARRTVDSMNPWTWLRTGRLVAASSPDLVVFQYWHPFFAPAYAGVAHAVHAMAPRARRIFICHNVLPHESSIVDRSLARLAFTSGDAFIVMSRSEVQHLEQLAPGRPVHVHPMPLFDMFNDDTVTREDARAKLGLEGEVVLFFGYVRAYKGLRYAIEALAHVVKERPVTLVVAGEFYDNKGPYLELIQRLGLEKYVRLVDRYIPNEEVAQYFAAADLVVQPYVTATQSAVSLIAFAFGKPVVATAVGGLPDIIQDGETGFLVESEDSPAIARRIVQFFREGLAPKMSENVRAARTRFSWASLADAVTSV